MTTVEQLHTRSARLPLRLRMTEHTGKHPLDGGWWPQSRDLTTELGDLVDNFPTLGKDRASGLLPARLGRRTQAGADQAWLRQVGCDAQDDTHVLVLTTSDRH